MGKQDVLISSNHQLLNDTISTTTIPSSSTSAAIPSALSHTITDNLNEAPRAFSVVKSNTTTTSLSAKPSTNKRKAPIAPPPPAALHHLLEANTQSPILQMPAKVISSTTTTTTITIKEYTSTNNKSNKSSTKSYSSCGASSDSSSADSCCESLRHENHANETHETNITLNKETKSLLNSTSSAISSSNSSLSNHQNHSSITPTTNTNITNAHCNNTTLSHYLSDDTRTELSIDDSILLQFNESCNYGHREVAIDCPDNFVPQVKTRPSYPSNSLTKKEDKKEKERDKSLNTLSTFKSKFGKETKSKPATPEPFKVVPSAPKVAETNEEVKKEENEFEVENEMKRRLKETEEALLSQNVKTSDKMQMLKEAPKSANGSGRGQEPKLSYKIEGTVNSGFEHDDDEDATNKMETDSLDDFDDNSQQVKIKSVEHVVVVTEPKPPASSSSASSISQESNSHEAKSDEPLFKIVTAQNAVKAAPAEQNSIQPFGKFLVGFLMDFFGNFGLFLKKDLSDLFMQIDYLQSKLKSDKQSEEDVMALRRLYQTNEFQNALTLYNKLVFGLNLSSADKFDKAKVAASSPNSTQLADEVFSLLFFIEDVSFF